MRFTKYSVFSKNTKFNAICEPQEKMVIVPWPGKGFRFDKDDNLYQDIIPRREPVKKKNEANSTLGYDPSPPYG